MQLPSKRGGYIPQLGDIIRIDRPLYRHVGIYVGSQTPGGPDVVHNDKHGGVILSTLAEFSAGFPVYVHKAATGNYFQRQQIAKRALDLLGGKFDLLTFNCEHVANWAQSEKMESPQLQAFFAVLAIVVGLIWGARGK
jgi:hypothetical protein